MSNKTEEILTKSISRRTAIKAAAAAGAALYAAPAIDTLVAHAQTVTKFGNQNVFVQTCSGPAGYTDSAGAASISITPNSTCTGNDIAITSSASNAPGNGTAVSSVELGTTNDEIEVRLAGGFCNIIITNVADSCSAAAPGTQTVQIVCTNGYNVGPTNITSGKVALAACNA